MTIVRVHVPEATNPQDLLGEHRALVAASVGKVDAPHELAEALRLGFVAWFVASRRGDVASAEAWLDVQTRALVLLPELRQPHIGIDETARSLAAVQLEGRGDPSKELPAFVRRRARKPIRVPPGGIPYHCEACGSIDSLKSAKANPVTPVDWGPLLAANGDGCVVWVDGGPELCRLVLCCRRCLRRSIKRCGDEQWDQDGWIRCFRLVVGSNYCDDHRRGEAERERTSYNRTESPNAGRRATSASSSADDYKIDSYAPIPWLAPCLERPAG